MLLKHSPWASIRDRLPLPCTLLPVVLCFQPTKSHSCGISLWMLFPGLLWWDLMPHLLLSLTQCEESNTGNLLVLALCLLGFRFLTGILSHFPTHHRFQIPKTECRKDPHPAETLYSSVSAFSSQFIQMRSFLHGRMYNIFHNGKSVPFNPSYCGLSLTYHTPICLGATQCFI